MSNATAATTLSPEQARTLFDHLLPSIVQSRALTRELIRTVPDSKLDFLPIAGGETLSDLMWYLASSYDVFLNALCDAKFPELPAMPQPASVQAFLDWDDSRFEQSVQKAKALSNEDLLRPLTFGPFTQPAVEFMTVFLGNVGSHTGQLLAWLALAVQNTEVGVATQLDQKRADGELSDEELAGVAGGTAQSLNTVVSGPGIAPPSGPIITHNYNANPAIHGNPVVQQTQAGLGSLLGDGGGGIGAVGVVGGQATLLAWVIGSYMAGQTSAALKAAAIAGLAATMLLRI